MCVILLGEFKNHQVSDWQSDTGDAGDHDFAWEILIACRRP